MAQDEKVVSLHGGDFPQPGEPQQTVIEALQELLEMAKSAEIVGITAIIDFQDGLVSHRAAGFRSRRTVGELEIVKVDLINEIKST